MIITIRLILLAFSLGALNSHAGEITDIGETSAIQQRVELGANDHLSIDFQNDLQKANLNLVHSTGEGDITTSIKKTNLGPYLLRATEGTFAILESIQEFNIALSRFPRSSEESLEPKLQAARDLAKSLYRLLSLVQTADDRIWINGQRTSQYVRALGLTYDLTVSTLERPLVIPMKAKLIDNLVAFLGDKLVRVAFWDEITEQFVRFAPKTFSGSDREKIATLWRIMGMAIERKYPGLFDINYGCDFLVSIVRR